MTIWDKFRVEIWNCGHNNWLFFRNICNNFVSFIFMSPIHQHNRTFPNFLGFLLILGLIEDIIIFSKFIYHLFLFIAFFNNLNFRLHLDVWLLHHRLSLFCHTNKGYEIWWVRNMTVIFFLNNSNITFSIIILQPLNIQQILDHQNKSIQPELVFLFVLLEMLFLFTQL